jgi:predicted Zn-dependent protease with MMP-like domain
MNRERFEWLVTEAVEALPSEFTSRLENVDVVVQGWPVRSQLAGLKHKSRFALLGLYEGVPQTERTTNYSLVPPDKITIFQKPIEAICRSENEIKLEIQEVIQHEIAHHFGIGEQKLRLIGRRMIRR